MNIPSNQIIPVPHILNYYLAGTDMTDKTWHQHQTIFPTSSSFIYSVYTTSLVLFTHLQISICNICTYQIYTGCSISFTRTLKSKSTGPRLNAKCTNRVSIYVRGVIPIITGMGSPPKFFFQF